MQIRLERLARGEDSGEADVTADPQVTWAQLHVSDLIRLSNNDTFPADTLVLNTCNRCVCVCVCVWLSVCLCLCV